MNTVCIVVLNWNNALDTVACLDSLLALQQAHPHTIICCDNGSTDLSEEQLKQWAEARFSATPKRPDSSSGIHFILLRSNINQGYAGGNNLALNYALQHNEFDFIWLLNNDTEVEPFALHELLQYAAQQPPDCAALGSTLVDFDHPEKLQCAGGAQYWPLLTFTKPILAGKPLSQILADPPSVKLDFIAGAAMLIRTKALKEVGGLNESFHLYYEEIDLAIRLRQKGYRIDWCPNSIVRHRGGASTGSRTDRRPRGSFIAEYHENLSTLLFTAIHYPWLLPMAALARIAMKLSVTLIYQRWHTLKPLIMAYHDFLLSRRSSHQAANRVKLIFTGTIASVELDT